MSNKSKYILLAILIPVLVVLILICTHVICIFHEWLPATCEMPESCQYCDAMQGEPLGHRWEDATCETAKTCTVCADTEGKPLGHDWVDATCLKAKECRNCGETEGEPAGHEWKDATCEEPKTCASCGETEGEALGHREGEYELVSSDPNSGVYSVAKKCNICNKILDTQEKSYKSYVDGKRLIITPKDFVSRLNRALLTIASFEYHAVLEVDVDRVVCKITSEDDDVLALVQFIAEGADEVVKNENATNLAGFLVGWYDNDCIADILMGTLYACNPNLTNTKELKEVALEVIEEGSNEEPFEYNGIKYLFVISGDSIILVAMVSK